MQHILKNIANEPQEFKDWKLRELPIDWQATDKTPTYYWKELCSQSAVFEKLQEKLLVEQGFLCCYCCCQITNNEIEILPNQRELQHISIEHLETKESSKEGKENLAFDYLNLLASCNSKGSCNLKRNNKPSQINPCDNELITQIILERKGSNIALKSDNQTLQDDIEKVLNLNNSALVGARSQIAKKLLIEIATLHKLNKSGLEIKNELQSKYTKLSELGKYPAFVFVAHWVINKKFP